MNKTNSSMLIAMCVSVLFSVNLNAQEPSDSSSKAIAAIKEVMGKQESCWNNGDIEGFMKGYWKSEKLTFSAGGKTTRGWQATLDNYKKSYPSDKMGQLKFDHLEFSTLGPQAMLVLGQWHLNKDGLKKDGNFSLVFKNFDKRWLIVHDHSSSLEEKTEKEKDKLKEK